jgi:Aminoacyl-tRNA editing domain
LGQVPHVRRLRRRGALVEVEGAGPAVARVDHAVVTDGIEPADLRLHQPTLEDVYLRLIGPTSRREAAVRKLAETTWVELGVAADEVLKTVAVRTRGTYVLAVVPASRRLELRLVRKSLDDPDAWLASEGRAEGGLPRL